MRRFRLALVVGGAVLVSAALLSATWTGATREEEQQVTLEEVPAEVRAAIQREAGEGVILEIVREVERSGRVTYEAEILGPAGWLEVEFASDGTVLEREAKEIAGGGDDDDDGDDDDGDDDDDDDDDGDDDDGDDEQVNARELPDAVRRALTEHIGHRDYGVWMERERGVTVYEARWRAGDRAFEAEVTADGVFLEIEERIPVEAVPPAVRLAAEERLPGATEVTYQKLTVFIYEIEAVVDGREREVLIRPSGRVLDR